MCDQSHFASRQRMRTMQQHNMWRAYADANVYDNSSLQFMNNRMTKAQIDPYMINQITDVGGLGDVTPYAGQYMMSPDIETWDKIFGVTNRL